MSTVVINTRIGQTSAKHNHVNRLWLEGAKLVGKLNPGDKLKLIKDPTNKVFKFVVSDSGEFTVSKRTVRTKNIIYPLFEFVDKSGDLKKFFGDLGTLIRVIVKDNMLIVKRHILNQKQSERTSRLLHKLKNKIELAKGSICSGGGILDASVASGLERAGIQSYSKLVVEREKAYLDVLLSAQKSRFRPDSIIVESDIKHFTFNYENLTNGCLDILLAGLPCTGSSKAGKSKNGISKAEFHEDSGAVFYYFLEVVRFTNPSIIILENVVSYASETSYAVVESVLKDWGYTVSLKSFNGCDFGALENRDRLAMVAHCKSLGEFDISKVVSLKTKPVNISGKLEKLADDDDAWKTYDYLDKKQIRDKKNGKGFGRTIVTPESDCVPTLRRGYKKAGSCETFLQHPNNQKLSRLFTEKEHAAFKDVPHHLVDHASATTQHEILGQGVVYSVFEALGLAIAKWLNHIVLSVTNEDALAA